MGYKVLLGNPAPVQMRKVEGPDGETESRERLDGESHTYMGTPEDWTLMETIASVTAPIRGVHAMHSDAAAPSWVAADNDRLADVLAEHYGCPVRPWDDVSDLADAEAQQAAVAAADDEPKPARSRRGR